MLILLLTIAQQPFDAIDLLVDDPQAKLLAGGTDVLISSTITMTVIAILLIFIIWRSCGELRWRKMAHYVSALQQHYPAH